VKYDEALAAIQQTMHEMFDIADAAGSARLIEDLGLDSIDAIDMAARMHEITGVRVEDAELRSLRTVDDVVALLLALTNRTPATSCAG
jgi:acyl carrier protein